ncbi:MAG TPA: hypothetical protein VNA68_01190 [Candidatus Dormibacteraeota bacterium]|nr:hypothetical protein [Candidatus Dormibacteraeota bacterium]
MILQVGFREFAHECIPDMDSKRDLSKLADKHSNHIPAELHDHINKLTDLIDGMLGERGAIEIREFMDPEVNPEYVKLCSQGKFDKVRQDWELHLALDPQPA